MNSLKWLADRSKEANELYNEVIATNCYALTPEICQGKDFIDIGANIGMFSIFASTLGASKVIAVEPVSTTVEILKDNIKQANLNNIFVVQGLVSSINGESKEIGLEDKSGHNSVYSLSDKTETIGTVTLKSLLNLVDGKNIFLKIDCEGSEYDVLLNADPRDMARIQTIAIEIHEELHPHFKGAWHIHKALHSFGYKPIQQKQMKAWNVDPFGKAINIRDLPVIEEIWTRNE